MSIMNNPYIANFETGERRGGVRVSRHRQRREEGKGSKTGEGRAMNGEVAKKISWVYV